MHHGAQLVERDIAVGRHADREHQGIGRRRAALDHAAHQRQVHSFVRGRVHQPRGAGRHAQRIVERAGAIGTKGRAEVAREAGRPIGRQHGLVHGQRRLGAGRAHAGAVVLEEYLGADFGGSCGCPDQFEAANIEIGVVIALCRQCRPILDEHAVVLGRRGVFDPVAGQYAGDGGDPGRKADGDVGIVHRSVRVFDNLPGGDVDHANIRDRDNGVVCITIDEIDAGFSRRVERGDLDLGTLAALQLDHVEGGGFCAKDRGEVYICFNVGFVLIKVGNREVLPGAGDEREAYALLLSDHLVVGAKCRGAARLAGIDRVAGVDVDATRLICGVLAGGNDRHIRNPAVDHRGIRCREHQEEVLTGRGVRQTERRILGGSDEDLVQQIERIIGAGGVCVIERLVQCCPDLASGHR